MKRSTRLLIALVLTALLVAVSANAWAETGRKGTVPVPPRNYPGRCNNLISFDLGTVYAYGAECRLNVKLVKEPARKVGPPRSDWEYLFVYAVDVRLVQGKIDSMVICVPLIPDWQDKVVAESINWYRWNETTEEWIAIPTTIEPGPPAQICGTSDRVGTFSLQGQ